MVNDRKIIKSFSSWIDENNWIYDKRELKYNKKEDNEIKTLSLLELFDLYLECR